MSNIIISPNKIYELILTHAYVLEVNQEGVTIFDEENGYGAINITNYKIPENYHFDIEEEIKDFAISVNKNVNSQTLQVTIDDYASSEFVIEDEYWKIWVFFKNRNALFASYNCEEQNRRNEIDRINKIMQSLKILL